MQASHNHEPIGVVLAGGDSRRMGRDKARLRVAESSLAERAAVRLYAVCTEVVIADRGRRVVAGERSIADGPGRGPAAALLGAAEVYPGRSLLALACDLPAVTTELLRHLARPPGSAAELDAHVPRWQRGIEPLCALYLPSALAALSVEVAAGRFALHRLLRSDHLRSRYLEGTALTHFGAPERLFSNLNTPQDLARWQGLA
ncbi:MAG: molybdenum cofactor guanylyltransferase [Acidobacteriota bacterium]